ncbi:hypothetical protein [Corynebacterium sp.]|uniref:hypothetical protein n=1 Tax=Corynebacterium sp. TaxID=1720 RepID=UPI003B3A97CE
MLLRGIGMCLAAGLLALWARDFLVNEMDRGWVSAKIYMLMTFGALFSAWFVVKGTRPVEEDADG